MKETKRVKGKLVKWHEDKAFGFIAPNSGGKNVFIHKTALCNKDREPKLNDIITFSMSKDRNGRYCASNATFTGEKLKIKEANKAKMLSVYLSLTFLATLSFAYFVGELPVKILSVYIGLSVFTFIAYAVDKLKAQRGAWRTQESTLHLLSLVGGWPGAAFAQQFLRHKSAKKPFLISYWMTIAINIAALTWLVLSDNVVYSAFA